MDYSKEIEDIKGLLAKSSDSSEKVVYLNLLTKLYEKADSTTTTKFEDKTEVKDAPKDPVDLARAKREQEELVMAKARANLELEQFVNEFDTKYKGLIKEQNKLVDINTAEMDSNHKAIRKAKLILADETNRRMLPASSRAIAESILSTNLTEEVGLDLNQAKVILDDLKGLQEDKVLQDLKLGYKNKSEQKTLMQSKFEAGSVIVKQ